MKTITVPIKTGVSEKVLQFRLAAAEMSNRQLDVVLTLVGSVIDRGQEPVDFVLMPG